MSELDSYFKQTIAKPAKERHNGSVQTYLVVNSLFRQNNGPKSNELKYSVIPRGNSGKGDIGVSIMPTQMVGMKTTDISIPIQSLSQLPTGIFHLLVVEFGANSFSSPFGFNYHFSYYVERDAYQQFTVRCIPNEVHYFFKMPVTYQGSITFQLFTQTSPYQLILDKLECYMRYSGANYQLYCLTPHTLASGELIQISNCFMPITDHQSLIVIDQSTYSVTVVDDYTFDINVPVLQQVATNINRPADKSLGGFVSPTPATLTPQLNPIITTCIPHGLVNGSQICINNVQSYQNQGIIGQYHVFNVTSDTFQIVADMSTILNTQYITITGLPISKNRVNVLDVKIINRAVSFELTLVSKSSNADNGVIVTNS